MPRIALSFPPRWVGLRRIDALGAPLLCAYLALAAPSCRPAQPPPALATGERPVTGVAPYDRFFADLSSVRSAVDEAREDANEAQHALARRVGLPEKAPIDAIGARLRERTMRWASEGLTLELEVTGIDDVEGAEVPAIGGAVEASENAGAESASSAPSATLRTPGREPQRRELRLLEAIAQAALSGATAYSNMGQARRHVERLEAEQTELRGQLGAAFADPTERDRVRGKLEEAATFLPELKARTREVGGSADALISVLEEAANTVPVVPTRRRPGAPTPKAVEPRVGPLPGRPSATPAPSPAPAPSNAAAPASPAGTP